MLRKSDAAKLRVTPVGGTLAGGLPDGEDTVPGLGEEPPGVRAGERA